MWSRGQKKLSIKMVTYEKIQMVVPFYNKISFAFQEIEKGSDQECGIKDAQF